MASSLSVARLKQNQLNRDHAEVMRDIKLAKGDPETVRLGSPNSRRKSSGPKKHQEVGLTCTVSGCKGTRVRTVWED